MAGQLGAGGFEPASGPAERRDFFDLRRLLNRKPDIQVGGTQPAEPRTGDLWFDAPSLKIWDGDSWETV